MSWPLVPLERVLDSLQSGSRPVGGAITSTEGIPSLGGEHLDSKGGFRFDRLKFIPSDHFDAMPQGKLAPWDILLVKDGATTGKVALVRPDFPFEKAAVNEHVFLLRVDRDVVDPAYAFYFLLSPRGRAEILRDYRGATIGGISRAFASIAHLPVPPLQEQRRLVNVLDQADRLRRLREGADAKYERILPTLFVKLFGDPATNPNQWPMRSIEDLCRVISGATPDASRDEYWGGSVPWVTPRDLAGSDDWILEQTARTLTDVGVASCAATILPKSAVLVSSRAPIGSDRRTGRSATLGLAAISGMPAVTNHGITGLVCGHDIDPWYMLAWCRLRASMLWPLGHGAAFKALTRRTSSAPRIPVPPLAVQKRFRVLMKQLHDTRRQARIASAQVQSLFSQLLASSFPTSLTAGRHDTDMRGSAPARIAE